MLNKYWTLNNVLSILDWGGGFAVYNIENLMTFLLLLGPIKKHNSSFVL